MTYWLIEINSEIMAFHEQVIWYKPLITIKSIWCETQQKIGTSLFLSFPSQLKKEEFCC